MVDGTACLSASGAVPDGAGAVYPRAVGQGRGHAPVGGHRAGPARECEAAEASFR